MGMRTSFCRFRYDVAKSVGAGISAVVAATVVVEGMEGGRSGTAGTGDGRWEMEGSNGRWAQAGALSEGCAEWWCSSKSAAWLFGD